jgi:Fe2+ or Zn2+ uptake regulation protein
MKRQYECRECGKVNEFETKDINNFQVRIAESEKGSNEQPDITHYIVYCQYCHAKNEIVYDFHESPQ